MRSVVMLLLLAGAGANAAEVAPTLVDGNLGARVVAVAFPPNQPKDLTSGLTNRIYARVSLLDADAVLGQRALEIAIRYDLWDQNYSVVSSLDGAVFDTRVLGNVSELNALLAALPLPRLFAATPLSAARPLTLRVELLLNPIDREKLSTIRRWVAQNSTPEVRGDQGASMSNSIFNRIFEQYAKGDDLAAVWRVEITSAPFRLDGLADEKR
jgi:hypothetical protein